MQVARPVGHSAYDAVYSVPEDALATGSTLGSPKAVVMLKAGGAIDRIYGVELGEPVFGSITLRYFDERTGMHLAPLPDGHFLFHAEHQDHVFRLSGQLHARETVFVLSADPEDNAGDEPPAVYYCVELRNEGPEERHLSTYAFAEAYGDPSTTVDARYDERLGAMTIWREDKPQHASIFGCSLAPRGWEMSEDHALGTAQRDPRALSNQTPSLERPLAILHISCSIAPGQTVRYAFLMTCSADGAGGAARTYRACPAADAALERTIAWYRKALGRAVVLSPNPQVNRGVLWAKANMLRSLVKAPTGWAFTNNPGRSNSSVARDTSWFAFGVDYVAPWFAHDSLLQFVRRQEQNGLIVEYYNMLDGTTDDYGLNINDNTPLLILALWHHFVVTGDREFLREVYPAAVKAARRIVSQQNEQGLVWCTADGTGEHGIIGWRNVIQGYRLSGATTEVNCECYAAFDRLAQMAAELGHADERDEFTRLADALKSAIHAHLYNPDNGLYYLNIDLDGSPRSDVTTDVVFPVMFGIASDDQSMHIISRLNDRDFWTEAGLRTVPRDAPSYSPVGGYGLMGGVWVAVTFWYAFAAARHAPEYLDHALGQSFEFYSSQPQRYNTVPGQFSEWLHGETLTNEGMTLSPWFPPRYLWAAVEGAGSLEFSGTAAHVVPRLASEWKWLAVRNLPFRGTHVTWLVARAPTLHVYTNHRFDEADHPAPSDVFEEDITSRVASSHDAVCILGLRRGDHLLIFAGSTDDQSLNTTISVDAPRGGTYRLSTYRSLAGCWEEQEPVTAEKLRQGLVVEIERKGFRLFDLRRQV